MNRPVRRAAAAALALFALLFLNVNYLHVVRAEELRDDPRNTRLLLETYSRERGPIVAGDRAVAESVQTDDRLEYLRIYAGNRAEVARDFAHVTGFYSLVYGRTGIERAHDDVLSGDDERLFVRRLSDLVTGRSPQGGSVTLTLDPQLQQLAMRELGDRRGAVVALDPRTGAVLALASTPSYDPNVLSSHQPRAIREHYRRLSNDPQQPMLNRATQATYPPGSTFKIVTAAAALERGATPETQVPCPPALALPLTTARIRNFGNSPCRSQRVSLRLALQQSYNTAFGAIGLDLGDDALREQAERFGLNSRPEFALPLAESVFPDDLNPPQTAQSAIGQFDVRLTPLQVAMITAAVANGGVTMAPYVVAKVQAPDLEVLDEAEPRELGRAVSARTAAALTDMMEAVVAQGSGRRAQIPGVRVAGKTGTAQNASPLAHTWFTAFAPADDPRIAVAVLVEQGGGDADATGGRVAAPIARAVMADYLGRNRP